MRTIRLGSAGVVLACLLASGSTWADADAPESALPKARLLGRDFRGAVSAYRSSFDPSTRRGLTELRHLALEILRADLGRGDPFERIVVAGTLVGEGDREAIVFLEQALHSADPLANRTAADALADAATPETLTLLRQLSASSEDGRRVALAALAESADRSLLPLYMEALDSRDPGLRIVALRWLGDRRAEPARAAVQSLRTREINPVVQTYADFSLAKMGDPRSLARLKQRLQDQRVDVRDSAAGLLGSIDDPSIAPLLRGALEDRALLVRATAAASLTAFQDASGLAEVERSLGHPDLRVRIAAATSLARMHYGTARPLILKALGSPDPTVRAQALKVIGDHRDPTAAPKLLEATEHERIDSVRSQAVLAMGQVGGADMLEPLAALLPSSQDGLRHAAAQALVRLTGRLLQQDAKD